MARRTEWRSVWGVGRHVLGSQIFDCWLISSGFKVEHYAEGDVFNTEHKNKRSVAGPMAVWGPEIPGDFANNKLVDIFVVGIYAEYYYNTTYMLCARMLNHMASQSMDGFQGSLMYENLVLSSFKHRSSSSGVSALA